MSLPLQEIKDKIDIAEFIGSYIKLLPAGKNLRALCPFHQEKTPSFVVSPERQIWHCFGCGAGGDAIKFLMQYENLEFYEAVQALAEKAGIELTPMNLREQKELLVLFEINEKAKQFFTSQLVSRPQIKSYLVKRGLAENTIAEFELGFAPGGESLTLHLMNLGYGIADIVKAGLAQKTESGTHRDKFYDRIIFPIASAQGKTAGFTGRILPEKEKDSPAPKYLNTPETPIFSKSRILYGFHKSKREIAASKSAFLVEGQMDFLLSFQAGIKNCVAVSGTALTPDHLKTLRRLADTVVFSFDNDPAGLTALERSLDLIVPFDFNVKVIDLKEFKDPAEAAATDPTYFKQAVAKAVPAFSRLFDVYFAQGTSDPAELKRSVRNLLSKISNVKSAVEQNYWIKELALRTRLEERALMTDLLALAKKTETHSYGEPPETNPAVKPRRMELIARKLLALSTIRPAFLPEVRANANLLPQELREIAVQEPQNEPSPAWKTLTDALHLQAAYEFSDLDEPGIENEFRALVRELKKEHLKSEAVKLRGEVENAEKANDAEKLSHSLKSLQNIVQEIHKL